MSRATHVEAEPASLLVPRIVLIVATLGLSIFGALMIWSASSVTRTYYDGSSIVTVYHQLIYMLAGIVGAVVLAVVDYHLWCGRVMRWVLWGITVFMLVLVIFSSAGRGAYGATRWISIGSFTLQPSEFAKVTIIMMAAIICQRYFVDQDLDLRNLAMLVGLGIGIPLLLIVAQPDKGTTMIMGATVLAMAYIAGVPGTLIGAIGAACFVVMVFVSMATDYSRARIMTMFDPRLDRWGDGYQVVQGWLSFGSGGLFGTGIGAGRMKYGYLPFAHNDFIFAVIGEETGLVGCLAMIAAFGALAWAGFKIARQAPDLTGRLIATGGVLQLFVQMLVNICGVLAILPLTGKPIPFVSYGGSSVVASFLMVGLICSVSFRSELPVTAYEERRSRMRVVGEQARPRLTVHEGGRTSRATNPETLRAERDFAAAVGGRVSVGSNGMRRIDLGRNATDRLRGSSSGTRRR